MSYQIQCPQGHILEGDPAQARQVCSCPYCGTPFYMPDPPAMPGPPAGYYPPGPGQQFPPQPYVPTQPGFTAAPQTPPAWPTAPSPTPPETAPAPRSSALPSDLLPPGAAPSGANAGTPSHFPPTFSPKAPQEAPATAAPPAEEQLLHIPCPRGHILETPMDMLQTLVACPTCNEQFVLRNEDSLEFKEKKARLDMLAEEKLGKTWLTWAIVAVTVVVLGLLGLMIASALNETKV